MRMKKIKYWVLVCITVAAALPLKAGDGGVLSVKKVGRMSCTFVQTKESSLLDEKSVSSGTMHYMAPDKVRWEYTAPFSGIFIMNGNGAVFGTEGKMQKVDLARNRMFRSISRIMFLGLSGSPLASDENYQVQINDSGDMAEAVLVPRKKDMARVVSCVRLYVRKSDSMVVCIVMEEPGGDVTRIELHDIDTEMDMNTDIFEVK